MLELIDEDVEKLYLDNLPSAESYEKSFMHRDTITHLVVTRYRVYFLLTFFLFKITLLLCLAPIS